MQRGEESRGVPVLMASPSFREPFEEADDFFVSGVHHDSPQRIPAAPRCLLDPPPPSDASEVDDDDDDDGSEFAFVIKDPEIGPGITADEIFSNGQIRPVYPVFDRALLLHDPEKEDEEKEKAKPVRGTLRRLLIEEREEKSGSFSSASSSSSGADELEGIPPGTYCVWAPRSSGAPSPSPSRCRKSSSTGSSLRWRLRDLVVGRSHSDGKEKFVFLAAEEKKEKQSLGGASKGKAAEAEKRKEEKASARARGNWAKASKVDVAAAHRVYYGKGGQAGSGGARRSFLPYKQDLVGFFANVNGLTRMHHPF